MKTTFSAAEARRISLAAQGFAGQDRTGKSTWAAMKGELKRLHLLQIDSVNVLCRSHYLPLYSRLGNYSRSALDQRSLNQKGRELFECWAHEASLVPFELHPYMRWRMDRARNGNGTYGSMDRFGKENRAYLNKIIALVEKHGPIAQSDLPEEHKSDKGWWAWGKNKYALETLFDQGRLTTARRDGFERIYDLPERVIPDHILALPTPSERDAFLKLTDLAGQALGVGTAFDIRDYFRLPIEAAAVALTDAVEAGILLPVSVAGWKKQAYLHRLARLPRKAGATALLSPFDPLCWDRDRAERVFNFHYRIELYTPAPKRKFGYYVLPFLHGDHFAGRVCLKSDRQSGTLLANASHIEAGRDPAECAHALAAELKLLANFLGLHSVSITNHGNLAGAVSSALTGQLAAA